MNKQSVFSFKYCRSFLLVYNTLWQNGRAPQEHDAYFEHRYWRIRFVTTHLDRKAETFSLRYTSIDPACADRVLLRSLDLQSWGGQTFRTRLGPTRF